MVGRSKRGGAGFGSRSRATSLPIQPVCCAMNVAQPLSLQQSIFILGTYLRYTISYRNRICYLIEEKNIFDPLFDWAGLRISVSDNLYTVIELNHNFAPSFPPLLMLSFFCISLSTLFNIFPDGSLGISSMNATPPTSCL